MPKTKQISKMPREKKTNNVIGVVVEYKTSLGIWESFLLLRAKKMMFIEQPFERVFSCPCSMEILHMKGVFYASYAKNPEKKLIVCASTKQARHYGYGPGEREFAVRDLSLEKMSSLELRTKLFEEPNIQLAAAIEKGRAWETARPHARKIAG